jgi:Rod binding domain-containing protein
MMDIAAIDRAVKATELPLDRLASSTQVPEKEKIAEVSRQFEAVLLRQILSQANKPLFSSSLLGGGGTTGAIYQDMITEQLAERISQGGTFGFAKVLQTQMTFPETKAATAPSADSKAL